MLLRHAAFVLHAATVHGCFTAPCVATACCYRAATDSPVCSYSSELADFAAFRSEQQALMAGGGVPEGVG
eukprot:257951-Rhodomonas_salina.2